MIDDEHCIHRRYSNRNHSFTPFPVMHIHPSFTHHSDSLSERLFTCGTMAMASLASARRRTLRPAMPLASMGKLGRRAVGWLACVTVSMVLGTHASATVKPAQVNDFLLQELHRLNGVPGMSAAIIKDGRVVWLGTAGYADRERKIKVSPATSFRLASVSKFVTAVMLARLYEKNKIDLSAPVHRYLPEYPDKGYPITVLQLASHTSGTPHYNNLLDAARDERIKPFATVDEGLELFKNRPLAHPPGTAYLYSSFGFNLLSAVMERAAGTDFDSMLRELAVRAEAPSLTVELPGAAGDYWSKLYDTSGKTFPRGNISYNRAGGSMVSNAADLARVGMLALDAGYLSPATLQRFLTPQTLNDGSPVQEGRVLMGVGFRLSADQHGRPFFHHSGVMRGARSHISVYPAEKVVVAVLSNASWVAAMDSTASALAEPMLDLQPQSVCHAGTYRYEGTYKEQVISGTVRIESAGRVCKATMQAHNELGKQLANGSSSRAFTFYGNGHRMAVVTPIGLFPATFSRSGIHLAFMGTPITLQLLR
jgi:CubicO group peptidase (beta-lactamase class C family)